MKDIDIEDTRQPTDETCVFIECSICESVENVEDATHVYQAEHICLECYNEIFFGQMSIVKECFFCHEDSYYRVEGIRHGTMYMCVDCFSNIK